FPLAAFFFPLAAFFFPLAAFFFPLAGFFFPLAAFFFPLAAFFFPLADFCFLLAGFLLVDFFDFTVDRVGVDFLDVDRDVLFLAMVRILYADKTNRIAIPIPPLTQRVANPFSAWRRFIS
ncbi:MAG: hypothetical protein QF752_12605, partial [Planctomycetota bacterium]|nr:hypothetical protein [Planctomycetota bacterium]